MTRRHDDTRLGQLAIARGLLSLGDLLTCVHESAQSGASLPDVLIKSGLLSNADLVELEERLAAGGQQVVEAELEKGSTIVFEEFTRSVTDFATMGSNPAVRAPGTGAPQVVDGVDLDLGLAHEQRYEMEGELGRGGMGRVFLATDKILRRKVAVKSLVEEAQTEKGRHRLLVEAQVTGLLEHPSIVPVYDLRASKDGEPFYTMRVVQEQSLGQILAEMRSGASEHSLTSLVSILRQVSLALQFAHDLGVVHRDLKPENILVGKYGEVYVIDWGVAKIVNANIGLNTTSKMSMGQLVGTPQYMAPEQARGDNDAVDERSDVYALGAVLYEILTLQPIFEADHLLAILFQVVHDAPVVPTERAPDRTIPGELEDVCLRALAKAPEARYQTAEQFADELELFLEGVKERERNIEMANAAMEQAWQIRAIYDEVRDQLTRSLEELDRERRQVESWAPVAEKEPLWDLQQQVEDLQVEIERRFGETVRVYGQALVHLPQMPEARRALADLYWQRFEEAEATGNLANAAYFEGLVRQYNDGAYDRQLEGDARLTVETEPAGATVTLYRYQQVRRRLLEWRVAELGTTPIASLPVAHGSHLLEVESPGYAPIMAPVLIRRAEESRIRVRLYEQEVLPENFVVVSEGEFISGNAQAGAQRVKHLPDYAIMRYPVTVGDYLEFLNDIVVRDSERARRHAPRVKEDGEPYLPQDPSGRFYLPDSDPDGDVWSPHWPIFMVNYYDAMAYAEWLSGRIGRRLRLPTIDEWEKAARGVDGRIYPWGNHFDAAFCLMRESRRGRSTPAPVGTFGVDRSPYGLMDVAGNVAEWTSTEDPGSEGVGLLGGAAFNSIAVICRLDFNLTSPKHFPYAHYGFRLVMPLDGD